MKKLLSIVTIASALFLLNACDEELTYDFPADFKLKMDVNVEPVRSTVFPFTHTEVLDIASNEKVAENIDKIKDLDVDEVECFITGIPEGDTINELTIGIEEVAISVTLNDITSDYSLVLPVSDGLLDALSDYLFEHHQSTVNVSGTSTAAPMVLGIKLVFHSEIEAPL